MIKFRPRSWSEIARDKSDNYYNWLDTPKNDSDELYTESDILNEIRNSYRYKLIIFRTAKRFGRLIRGKR